MRSIPVLAYHKVSAAPRAGEPAFMAVPPERFEEQVAWLARSGYRSVPAGALLSGSPLPERPILVTFDDGYRDNHDAAFPILARHGFTALVFLVGDYLPRPAGRDLPPPAITPDVPMLSPDHIAVLQAAGWSFGSHGMHHRRLTELGEDEVRYELTASRDVIGATTGRPVDTLAYPYSAWSPRLSTLARECGYRVAFTIRNGPSAPDPFAVKRVLVGPGDTPRRLAVKLSSAGRLGREVLSRAASAARAVRAAGARRG